MLVCVFVCVMLYDSALRPFYHCIVLVSIVAEFTHTRPNDQNVENSKPQTKKEEKLQKKLLKKLGAITKIV